MKIIYRVKAMTVQQRAYLAGLIDGEGYVGVTRTTTSAAAKGCRRGASYRSMLAIHMTDRAPLDFAAEVTGFGRVAPRKMAKNATRQPFAWVLWSNQAAQVLRAVMPYLLVKSPQAAVVIAFQEKMRLPGRNGLSDAEWSAREAAHVQSRSLSHRRVA